MVQQTIRWQQRFNNYRKALVKLAQAVELLSGQVNREEAVDELMQEGLIQRFEYTHELAWKVMKDYAEYQGYTDVRGSRDAIRKALEMGLIDEILPRYRTTYFAHIFSGGYSAGYYSYLWAEVLDKDAFELFMQNGILDTETSMSFRRNILEKGGSEEPMVLYRKFRGADPDPDALTRARGL